MARRSLSALGQLQPWTPACMWRSLAQVMGFVPQVTGDASARGSDGSGSGPANLRFLTADLVSSDNRHPAHGILGCPVLGVRGLVEGATGTCPGIADTLGSSLPPVSLLLFVRGCFSREKMVDPQTSWRVASCRFLSRGWRVWRCEKVSARPSPVSGVLWLHRCGPGEAACPFSPSRRWRWHWGFGDERVSCNSVQPGGCRVAGGTGLSSRGKLYLRAFFSSLTWLFTNGCFLWSFFFAAPPGI